MKTCIKTPVALLLALVMTLTMSLGAGAADRSGYADDPALSGYIDDRMEHYSTPGLSVAVTVDGETDYICRGMADMEKGTPMTEDSVLGIGSCSKAFTALAIFLLQEEGRLSIEDSVSDYIPWWHVTWNGQAQDVKLWQLLDHCSGIPDSTMLLLPAKEGATFRERTVRNAENCALTYEPGTQFAYCNLGYDLLAYIVDLVSGMTFEDYVQQEILLPLGMTHTGYQIPAAQGYRWLFGKLRPFEDPGLRDAAGCGGLFSTASDMSRWIDAQLGNTELPEKLAQALDASHEVPAAHAVPGADLAYSYGWIIDGDCCYHTGTDVTYSSMILIDRSRNVGIFAATNAWTYTADYCARAVYDRIKGEPVDRGQETLPDLIRLVDTVSTVGVCSPVWGS